MKRLSENSRFQITRFLDFVGQIITMKAKLFHGAN